MMILSLINGCYFDKVAAVGDKTSMKNNDCDKEGVSGSQTKTKPFDICTPKQGGSIPRLKPPLFKGNRERRKEQNQISKGDQLRPGMIHLKGYISLTDQVKIVRVCRELGLGEGGFYQPSYEGGAMLKLKMMCLGRNWDPQTSKYEYQRPCDGSVPPKIPNEFLTLVDSAIKDSHSLAKHPNSKLPLISPDICIVNYYANNGQLGLHQVSIFLHSQCFQIAATLYSTMALQSSNISHLFHKTQFNTMCWQVVPIVML